MKIYSWDEITRKKVPDETSLRGIRDEILQVLRRMHEKKWIQSGVVYGSAARGDAVPGSDVDVLVICRPGHLKVVRRAISRMYREAMRYYVSPEVVLMTTTEARAGTSSMTPYLLRHVNRTSSDYRVGDAPIKWIRVSEENRVQSAVNEMSYLRNTLRKNEQRLSHERGERGTNYYKALSKSVDATTNLARRLLEVEGRLGKKGPDDKETVFRQILHVFATHPTITKPFTEIMLASRAYQDALTHAVKVVGRRDKANVAAAYHQYQDAIHGLERAMRASGDFVTAIEPFLARARRTPSHPTIRRMRATFFRKKPFRRR